MNWTSIIKISLFVGAVHMAAAVPNDLLHTNELGSVKNKVDGAYDNSEASGATLDLLEEVKDAVSSPRGLRGVDAEGLFNGDNMPHNENAKNSYRSKLTEPPVNATVVENEYIVVLEESVADVGAKMGVLLRVVNRLGLGSEAEGFGSLWNINDRFKGQAVKMTHEQAEMMSELNGVRYIEHNTELVDQSRLENEGGSDDIDMASRTNNDVFPWNLDRIDQKTPKLDQTYTPTNDGTGVLVIILDGGIRETHDQFKDADGKSRVVPNDSREFIPRRQRDCTVSPSNDALNSGTSAAAIAGGNTFGVAKGVSLVDIRLSCGRGPTGPTASKDYYIEVLNHIGGLIPKSQERIVVNGGFDFRSEDVQNSVQDALNGMIDEDENDGVVFVTTAGDAVETEECSDTHFPANLDNVISVGATQLDTVTFGTREKKQDGVYSRTNTACADIYAPGVDITLAKASSDRDSSDKRDASSAYAAPHVTGAVAMILQEGGFKDKTPKEVKAELIRRSAIKTVKRSGGDLVINYVFVGKEKK